MTKIYAVTSLLTLLLLSTITMAQCTVDPVPNNNGVFPSTLDDGCVNVAYTDTSTLVFLDTVVPGVGLIIFDSIFVTGFGNVPAGLSAVCGSATCSAYPGGPGTPIKECILISGTPTVGVTNNVVQVYITAWVTVFGSPTAVSDSVQITLTINNNTASSETVTACDQYFWPVDANLYTTTGSFTSILTNAAGCDSTITLDLTISTSPVNTVSQVGPILTADAAGAEYQWLDCNNSNAIIPGATSQSYTGPDGDYAVQVSNIGGGCPDTSACFNVVVGILENSFGNAFSVYPNPTPASGDFSIALGGTFSKINVEVTNILGQLIQTKSFESMSVIDMKLDGDKGYYFVKITTDSGETARVKVLKR
jgi:hypothetical protein